MSIYVKYPARALLRGGQRTLLAIFCVAVGVMAIVALQLVGLMINNAFTNNVRDANGGDIAVSSPNEPLKQSDLPFFEQLKKGGTIQNYTALMNLHGSTGQAAARQSFSVRVVDPAHYPLVTPPTWISPKEGTIADLLKNNQVIATQAFIDKHQSKLGDTLTINIHSDTVPAQNLSVKIVGIVSSSGALARDGSLLLLSVNDYNVLIAPYGSSGQPGPGQTQGPGSAQGTTPTSGSQNTLFYDTINITANAQNIASAVKQIQQHFPVTTTQTAIDVLQQQQANTDTIRNFLSIAGLLALLVGGIGIVNTMQVLLSRRTTEIAMLKTSGHGRIDLFLLFGIEAGLLGLIGGVIGAGVAIGLSYLVRTIVAQSFGLNIPFALNWLTIGGGVLIGVFTALIFGLLPITQATNVRPLNVMRDESAEKSRIGRFFSTLFLLFVLSVLFCCLAIVILNNNVILGVASVYGVFIFLGVLSLAFNPVIFLISKLPVPDRFSLGYLALALVSIVLAVAVLLVLPAIGISLLVFALPGIGVIALPQTWKANIKRALRNIGRSRARTATTMLALFVGVFNVGLILALGQGLHDQFNSFFTTSFHYNLYTATVNDNTPTLRNRLKTLPGLTHSEEHPVVSTSPLLLNGKPMGDLFGSQSQTSANSLGRSDALYFLGGIEGYDVENRQFPATDTIKIIDGRNLQTDDAGTDHVVVSNLLKLAPLHLKVGDTIALTNVTGSVNRVVTIVGFYRTNATGLNGVVETIWGTKETVKTLSPVDLSKSIFYLQVDDNQLSNATATLGQAVPNADIFSVSSLTDNVNQFLNNVVLALITIASLSLLAGVIIIANAVALAMLERRHELGILKSIGHGNRSLLSEVLVENGIVGAASALIAMLLVILVITLLGKFVFDIPLQVSPVISLGLILGSAGLAMLVAALVVRGTIRVRPLEALRSE